MSPFHWIYTLAYCLIGGVHYIPGDKEATNISAKIFAKENGRKVPGEIKLYSSSTVLLPIPEFK